MAAIIGQGLLVYEQSISVSKHQLCMTKDGTNPVGRLHACAVTMRQAPQSDFLWLAFSFGKIYIFTIG